MHTGWIIAVCILTDILLERLEPRSHVRVRMSPERLKKIEQGNSVCYYGTSGPPKSIQDTTVIFLSYDTESPAISQHNV